MKLKMFPKLIMALALSSVFLTSCAKEDALGESRLDTTEKPRSELDTWLFDNYVMPYNIDVSYKWNQYMVDNSRYLYPPKPQNVKKVMNVVKKVWIDSYTEVTYPDFVHKYAPRQFVLIGGVNLNKDATQTLGLADQGERIVLFTVDLIDLTKISEIRRFIHTIQHEYVHILNQTKRFDKLAYGKITPSGYDSNWANYNDPASRNEGFISAYSRSNVDEDFAEIAATMLVDINAYNTIVDGITNVDGKAAIRAKEALVVKYYKDQFKIDFYELCKTADRNTTLASQLN